MGDRGYCVKYMKQCPEKYNTCCYSQKICTTLCTTESFCWLKSSFSLIFLLSTSARDQPSSRINSGNCCTLLVCLKFNLINQLLQSTLKQLSSKNLKTPSLHYSFFEEKSDFFLRKDVLSSLQTSFLQNPVMSLNPLHHYACVSLSHRTMSYLRT